MRLKTFLRISMVVALVVLSTIISTAQVGTVAAVQQDLWLRVGPGTQWRRVVQMPVGTNVALDGRDFSATWVRGITQNGDIGWMAVSYLNVSQGQVDALPEIDREAPIAVSVPPPGAVVVQSEPQAEPQAETQPQATGQTDSASATATANVNMRSGPGTGYRRVGGVNAGQPLNIDGRDASVGWVRGINSAGEVGWVSASYISLSFDEVAALRVVAVDTPFSLQAPGGGASQQSAAAISVPAPIAANTPVTGFSYGGHVAGLDDTAVNYMHTAGMTWAKVQIRYAQGADPSGVAGVINDAHAKGFRILLGVVGDPGQVNNGGYFEAYAAYVAGLSALGADAIEIWNEPNLAREWPAGQIDPARYTQLLAGAFNAIKATNSNTLVISAALAPTGAEAAFPGQVMNDNNYLAGMVNAGALNYMDCVGIHYNEGIIPPTQNGGDPRNEYYTRYYNGMVNTYWNITSGRRPLCFTELGYLTPEGYPPLPGNFAWASNVTVAQQAAWLQSVIRLARNSGRVRMVIIWNVNFLNYGEDPMGGYAMIRPDGSCPSCYTIGR